MDRWSIYYISTNGRGGLIVKAALALIAWAKCGWLIGFQKVGLTHVHTASFSSFWRKSPIFALAIVAQQPLIVSLHGGAFRDFYANRSWLGKAWVRLVMRRAERFVVLTNSWKRWVEATEPRSHVIVIPNSVPEFPELDIQRVNSPPTVRRNSDDTPLLLFLGRIAEEKGIFVLLEALAEARRRGANWQLVCAGSGDIKFAEERVAALGLSHDEVRFVGWIEGDAKRDLLRSCQMFVLPSFVENMPVVLLEAFAYAKPVVATSVGGIPDMVVNGWDGFLFPAGDVAALTEILVTALEPSTDLQSMGARARAKAAAYYAPAEVIGQVEAVYRELLISALRPT